MAGKVDLVALDAAISRGIADAQANRIYDIDEVSTWLELRRRILATARGIPTQRSGCD